MDKHCFGRTVHLLPGVEVVPDGLKYRSPTPGLCHRVDVATKHHFADIAIVVDGDADPKIVDRHDPAGPSCCPCGVVHSLCLAQRFGQFLPCHLGAKGNERWRFRRSTCKKTYDVLINDARHTRGCT